VTWPVGGYDQGPGEPRPYQGSYPPSPFDPVGSQQPGGYPYDQPYPGQPGGGYPPAPRRRRTGLIVSLAVLGVLLVVGIVVGALYLRGAPPPVVPGWQVATSSKRKLAYDVPANWKVVDEERIIGFEDSTGPKVGMTGVATYLDGYCAEASASWRAAAGFVTYQDTDLNLVAADAARKWGHYGYLGPKEEPPQVDVGPPGPMTVNGIEGVYASSTVRVTVPSPCAPPTARIHALALPSAEGGSYAFVIFSDQEVPDALPEQEARRILTTIRATG
jgi:hypothetical protein